MKCDLDIAEENFLLEPKQNEFFIAKCMWIVCANFIVVSVPMNNYDFCLE